MCLCFLFCHCIKLFHFGISLGVFYLFYICFTFCSLRNMYQISYCAYKYRFLLYSFHTEYISLTVQSVRNDNLYCHEPTLWIDYRCSCTWQNLSECSVINALQPYNLFGFLTYLILMRLLKSNVRVAYTINTGIYDDLILRKRSISFFTFLIIIF